MIQVTGVIDAGTQRPRFKRRRPCSEGRSRSSPADSCHSASGRAGAPAAGRQIAVAPKGGVLKEGGQVLEELEIGHTELLRIQLHVVVPHSADWAL
jgi:hypothetical protein